MKSVLKKLVFSYLNSYYLPFTILLLSVILTIFVPRYLYPKIYLINMIVPIFFLLSLIGILVAAIWNLFKKKWLKGIINLFMFIIPSFFIVLVGLSLLRGFGPSEDNFGKDLVIPSDLKMEEPRKEIFDQTENNTYSEDSVLLDIYSHSDRWPAKPIVNTDLAILNMFKGMKRELLIRHLATSAKWVLTRDGFDKLYAYRRVFKNGFWQATGGYFGSYDLDPFPNRIFQLGIRIGIDGAAMHSGEVKATITKVGSGVVELKIASGMSPGFYSSYLILESQGPALEILEEEQFKQKPLTSAIISLVNKELTNLIQSPDADQKGFDLNLMPPESVKVGEPEIYILGQGGIYQVYGYINPGEPGYLYLKVYEHTKNTPLSGTEFGKRPIEYTGWSDNPRQQFFYNSQIVIGEGDWGTYYPARFELWFVPDSGSPERKIIDKVFKIEGHQR